MRVLVLSLIFASGCASTEPRPAPPQVPPAPVEARAPAPLGFGSLEEHSLYLVLVDRFHDGDDAAFPGRDPSDPLAFHGGDLVGVLDKLPYLADLGVSAVWLTPIHLQVSEPVGPEGERHWPLHGYWPEDHVELDPRFGSEDDLHAVIERAHALGLRVVLDVVTNHFGYGAVAARDPSLVRSSELGTCPDDGDDRTRCLFGLPDLKTEDAAVRERVVAWTTSWAERFGIDGFRLDAAKHVDAEVLWEVHDRAERLARERGAPGFLALAEHWGAAPDDDVVRAYTESGAADTVFDFSFTGLVEGFLTGRMRAETLARHLEGWHRAEGPPLVHFLDTHDTSTLVHRLGADAGRYPLAAFLQMSVRGVPLVTWGDELARGGGEWPHNRADMPWAKLDDDEGRRLHGIWRSLLHLRKRSPALYGRDYATQLALSDEDGGATLAFRRGADLLVIVHRGAARARVIEGLPPGVVVERCVAFGAFAGRSPPVDDEGRLSLTLPADAAAVFALADGGCG